MTTSTTQAPQVFVDEFNDYLARHNDILKEDLRSIEGVPNATYAVIDGRVFVFDKLVELVNKHQERQSAPLTDLARSLVADATVAAKDAVKTWCIVPEPYEIGVFVKVGWLVPCRASLQFNQHSQNSVVFIVPRMFGAKEQ